jgi:hypothetical protein
VCFNEKQEAAELTEPTTEDDALKDNPLEALDPEELKQQIKRLYEDHFAKSGSITENELQVGARLATSTLLCIPSETWHMKSG